jgi:hypothetical protein
MGFDQTIGRAPDDMEWDHGLALLEKILDVDELRVRPNCLPDDASENRALGRLFGTLARVTRIILQALADALAQVFAPSGMRWKIDVPLATDDF